LHGCETWSSAITKIFVSKTLETKTGGATVRQKNIGNDKFPKFALCRILLKWSNES